MKKSILLVFFISLFFINIDYAKCFDITDNNNNTDITGTSGTGSATAIVNGISGAEMQGIKATVFRANGTVVPGTNSAYIIVKPGKYYSKNLCTCGNLYDFNTTDKATSTCSCSTNSNTNYIEIDGITGTTAYWGLFFSRPTALSSLLNDNNYNNLYKVLDATGYKKSDGNYNYAQGDYLIIEPLVTVSCQSFNKNIYVTGTINSLIKNNFSFFNGTACGTYQETEKVWIKPSNCKFVCEGNKYNQYGQCTTKLTQECSTPGYYKEVVKAELPQTSQFIWYYSAIAQTFKTRVTSCANSTSTGNNIPLINKKDYSGCGYNQYDLSNIIQNYKCQVVEGIYYDINGNKVSVNQYSASCGCRVVTSGGKTTYYNSNAEVTSEQGYNQTCKTCAQRVTNNIFERISLYQEYKDKAIDYRNLLNLTKTGAQACSEGNPYTLDSTCLTINSKDTFTANNMSKYTYTTDINGKTAYCNSSFDLVSNIGTSWGKVISGRAYIGGNGIQSKIATAKLTMKCYLYSNSITDADKNADPFSNLTYPSVISSINLGGQTLEYNVTSTNTIRKQNNNYMEYTKTYNVSYLIPKVNIDKITGLLANEESESTTTNYGFYSKFSDNGTTSINFNVSFGSNGSGIKVNEKDLCYYTAYPELINGDLRLQFRTIDTSNPFIGKDGVGRRVGANWCVETTNNSWDCSSNNSLVQRVIINANNSYNKDSVTPKYRFVLTPSTINKIRDYNKTVKIDEYRTKCSDGICVNTFFEKIKDSITDGKDLLLEKR